ncbi:MAG: transporter [Gluconobacter cerinus]|uniref:ZIP family metal transporter n=1 Tax=Gluconobacter cerinus TaxID=38307 RepID=UPI0039EB8350
MYNLIYGTVPFLAVIIGAVIAVWRPPGEKLVSGMQHLAAGVIFAAVSVEILPSIMRDANPVATLIGGLFGTAMMLGVKGLDNRLRGPIAFLCLIGFDIFLDGAVLGLGFSTTSRAGYLLTIALTIEVLFLGLNVTNELSETWKSKAAIVGITTLVGALLPLGMLAAAPVLFLPAAVITGFLSFGLIALLYLVTEELLTEAHEKPDSPASTAMFFVGFLFLLLLDEIEKFS